MSAERTVRHVTCLGCGCMCDDVTVHVRGERITAAEGACPRGAVWFGDGTVPDATQVGGRPAALPDAIAAAARLLRDAARPLVLIADDLSCEAQGEAVALADRLHAMLDTTSGAGVREGLLVTQRRGRATATFGEIRNRADVVLFWGVDPERRYTRFAERVAPDPVGLHVPEGRRGRRVIAMDIGERRGPRGVDERYGCAAGEEVDILTQLQVAVRGRTSTGRDGDGTNEGFVALAGRLARARYAAIVHDAEAGAMPGAAEGLIALAQALNGPTRAALCTLRAGGNGAGAEAVLTWRTGFPFAVDFARGAPRYRPHDGALAVLARGEADVALVAGAAASLPAEAREALRGRRTIAVGPAASAQDLGAAVAIDTGVAGIHEGGFAVRSDDVPLPLRPALDAPASAREVLRALRLAVGSSATVAAR